MINTCAALRLEVRRSGVSNPPGQVNFAQHMVRTQLEPTCLLAVVTDWR